MLFLVHSLRNELCSVSAPNMLVAPPPPYSISFFSLPMLHPQDFAFYLTILGLTIFAMGKISVQFLVVFNTGDIFPSVWIFLHTDHEMLNTIKESLNNFC